MPIRIPDSDGTILGWMVTRDSCDPPEFFATEDAARKNACLGLADTHVIPLCRAERIFPAVGSSATGDENGSGGVQDDPSKETPSKVTPITGKYEADGAFYYSVRNPSGKLAQFGQHWAARAWREGWIPPPGGFNGSR